MSIVTFYSYKGGVGRSMALANIAFELAKGGKKVLIVDWDLEAPGLEKYFSNYLIDNTGSGLLPLLLSIDEELHPDYKSFLWSIHIDPATKLSFLHSGREHDPSTYPSKLENFDWEAFFKDKGGGTFLEHLRNQWHNDYDLVLIDSRTGLSDTSGICTILLPDIVIPLFTANHQSLYGVRDIMRYAQAARHKLEVERMALTILPVPTRFGTRVEFKESQEWLDRFAEVLKEFFSDWLPKWIEPKHVLELVKIPQVDYFSFGEKLAVAEQGTTDPESMGFIYAKIAALLASDFEDLFSFIGKDIYEKRKEEYERSILSQKGHKSKDSEEYDYDVFISHPHTSLTNLWISEFVSIFIEYMTEELGYTPKIFVNVQEVSVGSTWTETISKALKKSKTLLAILSPDYLSSEYNTIELDTFLTKERRTDNIAIIPVSIKSADYSTLPADILERQMFDFSEFNIDDVRKSHKLKVKFSQEVEKVAIAVAAAIQQRLKRAPNHTFATEHVENTYEIIKLLAKEYEDLRRKMKSGDERTRLMEYITSKMKEAAPDIVPLLPKLVQSQSAGERLAAIAALHKQPDPQYLDWLCQLVGDREKPFIGYQASVGLYILSKNFCKTHKEEIIKAIDKAMANISHSTFRDTNQINVLKTAKTELGYR